MLSSFNTRQLFIVQKFYNNFIKLEIDNLMGKKSFENCIHLLFSLISFRTLITSINLKREKSPRFNI